MTMTNEIESPSRNDVLSKSEGNSGESMHVNVGQTERTISLTAGAIVAGFGLSRFSLAGLVTAGLGAALMYRGMTGHCSTYEKMNIDTSKNG